jgi:NADH dehydrogenase (ubiquinone) 1 alpha subcomplex subunit 9
LIFYFVFQQYLSDKLTQGFPGLEDLGVRPTPLEAEAIAVLRRHRTSSYYEEAIDEDEICRTTSSH